MNHSCSAHLGRLAILSLALTSPLTAALAEEGQIIRPDRVETARPFAIHRALRDLPLAEAWKPGDPIKEIPRRSTHLPKVVPPTPLGQIDPLLEPQRKAASTRTLSTPLLDFAGQGFSGVNPPDTVGDIGPNHYVQVINGSSGALVKVYNKSTGAVAAGPFALESLGIGSLPGGDPCLSGFGDGVAVYDQFAGRWLLSEFGSTAGNNLCVYLSQGSDPTIGTWTAYRFTTPTFPDYPKYGVGPDAYYVTTNEDAPTVYALERGKMLAGQPAQSIRFQASSLAGFSFQTLTPADDDGANPPPIGPTGETHYFLRHRDDEAHNPPGTVGDFLEVWALDIDFATPGSSAFTGPTNIPISEFDSDLCGLTSFNCIPQMSSATTLDPLREVVMSRVQYRNFGDHQALVGNLVTDVSGTNHAGVRWFELRNSGAGWSLFQEGTLAPDVHHRWMASSALDLHGDMALGYSISSSTLFPGLRYSGRAVGDTLGTLQPEQTMINGSAANASNRWGDYAAMNVDPVDECTFWFTSMYSPASSWATRIDAFKLSECTSCGAVAAPSSVAATTPVNNQIQVAWAAGGGGDTYVVSRKPGNCASPNAFQIIAGGVAGNSFADSGLTGSQTFAYQVQRIASGGCGSPQSSCVSATTTGACTLAPSFAGLSTVGSAHFSTCSLSLAWAAATSNCAAGVTYNIYRDTVPGFTPAIGNRIATGVGATSYVDPGPLNFGTTYYYVVRAVDTANAIEESNTVRRSAAPDGPFSSGTVADTFEGGLSGGGFDASGWSHAAIIGAADWAWNATQSQTPTHSWKSTSQDVASDRVLVSPPIGVQASTTLSFWHTFAFEFSSSTCWDGGTLEVTTNGGTSWSVLPDAAFTAGLFTGTVTSSSSNPIGGKRAWCQGTIGAMTQVAANLASFAGNTVQVRWHAGDDQNTFATGWFVDSVQFNNALLAGSCVSAPPAALSYYPLPPCRVVDTRDPNGPYGGPSLAANATRGFKLATQCAIPSDATAVSLNLTVVSPTAIGALNAYAASISPPGTSILSFKIGTTRANNAVVQLGSDGINDIKIFNGSAGTVQVVVDVNGYFKE